MSGDGDRDGEPDNELGIGGLTDVRRFAVGSSAAVYRAEDVRHGRTVAVKVLDWGRVDAKTELALERELAAMGRLSTHPNIIDLYGSGTTADRRPYIVMPYYSGGNYADLVDESGPLPWQDLLDFGVKIGGALHTAHARGFVHRDIKPANIFRGEFDRQPILADFGIASFAASGVGGSFTVKVSATPLYGAPEVLEGERPTERSDIYSLGATLFALLEGSPAFTDPSTEVVVHRVTAARKPPRPSASMPGGLSELLADMMARDPEDRPATCLVVAQRLVDIQKAEGIDPTPIVSDEIDPADVLAEAWPIPPAESDMEPRPEPRPRPRIEPIVNEAATGTPTSTQPVGSLDRPTEPAVDLPKPSRSGPVAAGGPRPALQWALLAAGGLLVVALAYTMLNPSGRNPGELVDRDADDRADADLRAAWSEAGEPAGDWPAHPASWVTDVTFAPSGSELATAGTDGVLRVWPGTVADGPPVEVGFTDWVIDIAWSPDGERFAGAATDGTIAVAPADGGQPTIVARRGASAEAVAWNPSGTALLAGYEGGAIVMRSLADPAIADELLSGHDGDVLDVAWGPTGDLAVSSAKDGRVIVWNVSSTESMAVIDNPDRRWTRSVHWVAATLVLTTDDDGTVTLRSVDSDENSGGDTIEELSRIDIGGTVLATDLWLDHSVLLAAAYEDGSIRIWDLVTGDEVVELASPTTAGEADDDATAISWSSDGRALAVGRLDGTVQMWSLG